jgi:dynactin-6
MGARPADLDTAKPGGIVLGDYVTIEAGSTIEAGGTEIGEGTVVQPGSIIRSGARIGKVNMTFHELQDQGLTSY